MKKTIFCISVITLTLATLLACTSTTANPDAPATVTNDSLIKRGSYLVNAMGCDDCHSPKRFGPNGPELIEDLRFAGHMASAPVGKVDQSVMKEGWILLGMDGTSAVGPWGISYSANISSDATGIGNWTEEQFFTALREGKYKGAKEGRPLLPPMPWFVYKNLDDHDIRSIFAYLKSSKPVNNVVPGPKSLNEL
jgi:hypothetical protein